MFKKGAHRASGLKGPLLTAGLVCTAALSACGQAMGEHTHTDSPRHSTQSADPDSVVLTPEQRAALAGPDADGNGVRDDIDAWIAQQFPQSAKARAVWTNEARIQQRIMLATSKEESRTLSEQISDAVDCTGAVLRPLGWSGTRLQSTGKAITALLLDTPDRLRAFDRAENWASGTTTDGRVGTVPLAELCGFDPASLPN